MLLMLADMCFQLSILDAAKVFVLKKLAFMLKHYLLSMI